MNLNLVPTIQLYYIISHNSYVFHSSDNVKALYRRAKAHVGAWNPQEARQDFERVMELDSTLTNNVKKELKQIDELQKARDLQDKEKLKGLF